MPLDFVTPAGIYAATFLFSLLGGIVPFFNVEVYLLSLSALSPQAATLPVALAACLGQMAAKSLLYLAGRGLVKLPIGRAQDRIAAAAARLARAEGGAMTLVLTSALTGLPPFYAISLAAGVLRLRFLPFFVLGFGGRLARFAAVFILPRLWS